MTPTKRHYQSGFSAVELLITLFVAAAFLATGYQLYYATIESSGVTRIRAAAHNDASDLISFLATQAPEPCTGTGLVGPGITLGDNYNGIIDFGANCPYGTGSSLTQINVQVHFTPTPGGPTERIRHVLYAAPTFN